MSDSIAGIVLAAGAGTRLRPLTGLRPKALCPVDNRALVDHALDRFKGVTESLAVNIHHHRLMLESHLAGKVHLSIEEPEALGTAGAIGLLRDWIAGRATLVVNADTFCPSSVASLLDGWDGERPRLLCPPGATFGPRIQVAGSLLPWSDSATLVAEPAGLYERVWARAAQEGRLELVNLPDGAVCIDCGTPSQYLDANLAASGGASVIGPGAIVEGTVDQSVVWAGGHVARTEHLTRAIRTGDRLTVLVR